jgi:hypothetical protein
MSRHQKNDEKRPAFVFADVVNGTDMRVIDARGAACFSPESLECCGVGCQMLRQQLQCYFSAQAHIFRAEDDPHASPAKMLNDAIMRNGTAEHGLAGA